MLKGSALVAAFIGFLTIFAMWVSPRTTCGVHRSSLFVVVQYTTPDLITLALRLAFAHLGCDGGQWVAA